VERGRQLRAVDQHRDVRDLACGLHRALLHLSFGIARVRPGTRARGSSMPFSSAMRRHCEPSPKHAAAIAIRVSPGRTTYDLATSDECSSTFAELSAISMKVHSMVARTGVPSGRNNV